MHDPKENKRAGENSCFEIPIIKIVNYQLVTLTSFGLNLFSQ